MPIRADSPVLLDACVLAEASVADLYLRLGEEPRLILPKWTSRIWDEVDRTCLNKLGWHVDIVATRRKVANSYFEHATITGYEQFESQCQVDAGDRHVLAAAIHGKVEIIITTNLRHFPESKLAVWGVVAVHPANYLVALFEHEPDIVVDKIYRLARDRNRSIEEVLGRLAWTIPTFSRHVAGELNLTIPEVTPQIWRN